MYNLLMVDQISETAEPTSEVETPAEASMSFLHKWGARLPVLFTATYGPAATGFTAFMSAMHVKAGAFPEAAFWAGGSAVMAGMTVALTKHIWSLGSEGNGQSQ